MKILVFSSFKGFDTLTNTLTTMIRVSPCWLDVDSRQVIIALITSMSQIVAILIIIVITFN